MSPSDYERSVAEYFRIRGYTVRHTPASNDYGVDVFATNDEETVTVQAKLYGDSGRQVNRDVIMHLHGAKDYFDCDRAVLVTDAFVMADAIAVAGKLRIDVLVLRPDQLPSPSDSESPIPEKSAFDRIWETHVMPLVGLVMENSRGGSNVLTKVDWSGVERTTQNDRPSFIPIEIFRLAVAKILKDGYVSRAYINQMYTVRGSSGVHLILSQVPLFEAVPDHLGLRLRVTPSNVS